MVLSKLPPPRSLIFENQEVKEKRIKNT